MGIIESSKKNDINLLSRDDTFYLDSISLCNPDNEKKKNINIKDIEDEKTNDHTNEENETGKDDNINLNKGEKDVVREFTRFDKKKEQIFNIDKIPKKFLAIKIGRPKKNASIILTKNHPSSAYDNARKRIFNSCKKNSHDYITNLLPKELNIILHMPTIEKQMGYSYKKIREFFKKRMCQIFLDSIPKRVPDYLKEKRDEYTHNKNMIDIIFKSDNAQCRIVKGLLSLTFLDFLKAYLNDQNTIRTKNGNTYDITGFKTFGGCFNDCYNQAQKRVYKNHIIQIYESKTKDRKERRKK